MHDSDSGDSGDENLARPGGLSYVFFGWGLKAQELCCTGLWPKNLVRDFILAF